MASSLRHPFLTLCIICLISGSTSWPSRAADTPSPYAWAIRAGSESGGEKLRSLSVDATGNSYLTGQFAGVADFGAITLESRGVYDCFVAKVSPEGEVLWARTLGGEKTERGYGIDSDASGNVYVTGHFESPTMEFAGATVTSTGDFDIFTAKYGPGGDELWIRTGGGGGYDFGHGLAVDHENNCLIGGAFVGPATLDGSTLAGEPGRRAFAAKYDPSGHLLWARATAGPVNAVATGHDIAVDRHGIAYLSGTANPGTTFTGDNLPPFEDGRMIVFAINPDGNLLRAYRFGGPAVGHAAGVAVDNDGNIYVTGAFEGTFTGGNISLESRGEKDFYVAKLDPRGNLAWAHRGGGPGNDISLGLAANPAGGCYVTGDITGAGTIGEDDTSFTSVGGRDGFAAAFSPDGSLQWLHGYGGAQDEVSEDIARDAAGNVYFGGGIAGTSSFGKIQLTVLGTNLRNRDIFLAKIPR